MAMNKRVLIGKAAENGILSAYMAKEGITFQTNTEVGKNYAADRLLKEFDAVVLCTGATQANYAAPSDNGTMNLFRFSYNNVITVDPSATVRAGGFQGFDQIILNGGATSGTAPTPFTRRPLGPLSRLSCRSSSQCVIR